MRHSTPALFPALFAMLFAAIALSGCTPHRASNSFWSFGQMREVLRDGETHGRVRLADLLGENTFGVGLLADLDAEITIDDGVVYLSTVQDGRSVHRPLQPEDQATLLVLAEVHRWFEGDLGAIDDLPDLEDAIRNAALSAGIDPAGPPITVRITGEFSELGIHVLDHSCPIANPDGPPPWRWSGAVSGGTIVGFYVEGAGGSLTHHGQRTHLHAIFTDSEGEKVSGHLETVRMPAGATIRVAGIQ